MYAYVNSGLIRSSMMCLMIVLSNLVNDGFKSILCSIYIVNTCHTDAYRASFNSYRWFSSVVPVSVSKRENVSLVERV